MTRRLHRTRSKPESKPDSGFESRNQNFRFMVSGFGWGSPAAAPCLGGFRFPVFPHFPHFSPFAPFFLHFPYFLHFLHFSSLFPILGCSWRPLGSSGCGLLCRVESSSVGLGAVLPSAVWPCLQPILCRLFCPW